MSDALLLLRFELGRLDLPAGWVTKSGSLLLVLNRDVFLSLCHDRVGQKAVGIVLGYFHTNNITNLTAC